STLRRMYVLDPADGHQLWTHDIYGDDHLIPISDLLVLVSPHDNMTRGLDRSTGEEKWHLADPTDAGGNQVDTIMLDVWTPKDLTGPANLDGYPAAPDLGDDHRLLQITYDKQLNVVNADTGTVEKNQRGVGTTFDQYLAYDGKLYVFLSDSGYRIQAYDLNNLGEPAD